MDVETPDGSKATSVGNAGKEEVANDRLALKCLSATKAEVPNPTENELINVDDIELSDEDTWLYTPPKNLSAEEKELSPYKWLRKDVEDPSNRGLQMAKTALVSKLEELDILKAAQIPSSASKFRSSSTAAGSTSSKKQENSSTVKNCDKTTVQVSSDTDLSERSLNGNGVVRSQKNCIERALDNVTEEGTQATEPKLRNVIDVLERARLQEESLKQSSSRFFSEAAKTLPRAQSSSSPPTGVPGMKMSKPASIEALHTYNGRARPAVSSALVTVQPKAVNSSPIGSPYGSTTSLNNSNVDIHRSSLPNLNKGYHSLKKKAKRTSEPRIQCPLPMYPRSEANGKLQETVHMTVPKNIDKSPTCAIRESQTLPASYRNKQRNCCKRDLLCATLPRRESAPSSQYQRNPSQSQMPRRESMPGVLQQDRDFCNGKQVTAQQTQRKSTKTPNQFFHNGHSFPTSQFAKTDSMNDLVRRRNSSPVKENSRCSSHSPVKRQPLTSVLNHSPSKQDDNSGLRGSSSMRKSLPSKIPSPASRSGIPVPSQLTDRTSIMDDGWNQDFY